MARMEWTRILIILTVGLGCQRSPEQESEAVSLQSFESGPRLVKISVRDVAVADSLIKAGVDIIVVEPDYVIARLGSAQASRVQAMSLAMTTFREEELVQRLIRVVVGQRSALNELSDLGVDIWEVRGDTVIAQSYDKHIREIRAKGHQVEILEQDVRDLTKRIQK